MVASSDVLHSHNAKYYQSLILAILVDDDCYAIAVLISLATNDFCTFSSLAF